MMEMTFDVMPTRDGRRGAWVFQGGMTWREKKEFKYRIVDVLGVRCYFVSVGQPLPDHDWCFDFASRSLANDATIERVNLQDYSITVKTTRRYK